MSETLESLRDKIEQTHELESVVRTMKALAAASITQYERSAQALGDYYQTLKLGFTACFQSHKKNGYHEKEALFPNTGAIIFGSDLGLIGQFNDLLADYALGHLDKLSGTIQLWAVGERMEACLSEAGYTPAGTFPVPLSVHSIEPLVRQILLTVQVDSLYIFHHHPDPRSIYSPTSRRVLPLDDQWREEMTGGKWPTLSPPQILGDKETTLRALIREYLFVSLFKACTESLTSENISRLTAMQRAEKNIDEMLQELKTEYHRLRQNSIDEELFDVISGFEALASRR